MSLENGSIHPPFSDEDDGIDEALRRNAEMDSDPSIAISLEAFDDLIQQRRGRNSLS